MEGALAPHDAKAVLGGPMGAAMGALREGRAVIQVTNHCNGPVSTNKPGSCKLARPAGMPWVRSTTAGAIIQLLLLEI